MFVAFQGEAGAYSEAALRKRFGDHAAALPCASFDAVFQAVSGGDVASGVIPIENSLAGSILENYDLLLAHDLTITGEITLPVRHCLLARPGMRLEDVRRAYSHPQALAQSMPFLKAHGIMACAAFDTAGAARELAERDEVGAAAIASAHAGAIYGLTVLAEGIQTRQDNTTRFFEIARERPADLAREKASLVFAAPNTPGALYACLGAFTRRGLNMTKLESRPTRDGLWQYYFYLDFEGGDAPLTTTRLSDLMGELEQTMDFVRLLGAYPRADC